MMYSQLSLFSQDTQVHIKS